MSQTPNLNIPEEYDIKKLVSLALRHYRLFIFCTLIAVVIAALFNHYSTALYKVSSSILIKEDLDQSLTVPQNDYLNSRLVQSNKNFQNELWILKSAPVLEQMIKNLGLQVSYYRKEGINYKEAYKEVPFRILFLNDHVQPVGVRFFITFQNGEYFHLTAESKKISLFDFAANEFIAEKQNWSFQKDGRSGELIEMGDLAFIVELDTAGHTALKQAQWYGFEFNDLPTLKENLLKHFQFIIIEKNATVVEIALKSESVKKGKDIVNELMKVYSDQNLSRKNHIAEVTIDYIEKQLNEISDSLSITENNLQNFRSSNQLLNVTDQSTELSKQYMDLQNQLAELVTRKRYYDYVNDYVDQNDNFSNMVVPASLGIQDLLLSDLLSKLIASQAQLSNLIEGNQLRNPSIQKLKIEIANIKKTISENIAAVTRTMEISIDEMTKRIGRLKVEISRIPATQRKLGNIERKYKLNDAIYNYLLEKRAEAKITQASNLPDNIIIEPAKIAVLKPVSPNKESNYLLALFLGFFIPIVYLLIKNVFRDKIGDQEDIEKLASEPILGKIPHNNFRTKEIMADYPMSGISESFRSLRTNLDFYVRCERKKVIMVTSCLEGEGKTFIAINLAISYAQLGRRTILVDFDMRKTKSIFSDDDKAREGLSSFMINTKNLENIINKTQNEKLDYIVAGTLPPNPVELIALEKTDDLIVRLKETYDIIILDTPPLAHVADAYLLMGGSEVKVIVTRQNVTLKKVFSLIMKDLNTKNVKNICIVLNDNKIFRDQYGYGYGYYNKKNVRKKREM